MYNDPLLVSFIVIFVLFGSFGINGLLTGVISESIIEKNTARIEEQRQERETKRRMLEHFAAELFDEIDSERVGSLGRQDLLKYKDQIASLFASAGVAFPCYDFEHMFTIMDYDDSGTIEKTEFVHGILELCDEVRPMSIMELHSQMSRCNARFARLDVKVELMAQGLDDLTINRAHDADRLDQLTSRVRDMTDNFDKLQGNANQGEVIADQLSEQFLTQIKDVAEGFVQELSSVATPQANGAVHGFPRSLSGKEEVVRDGFGEKGSGDDVFSIPTGDTGATTGAGASAEKAPQNTTRSSTLIQQARKHVKDLAVIQDALEASLAEDGIEVLSEVVQLSADLSELLQQTTKLITSCVAKEPISGSNGGTPSGQCPVENQLGTSLPEFA